jgi:hypothetical protein
MSPRHGVPASTCYATVWNTIANSGWVGVFEAPGVTFDVTLEELDDVYGHYCGQIRSKNTVTRTSSACNTPMGTETDEDNNNYWGDNDATWTGCGGSYYALFGFAFQPQSGHCYRGAGGAASGNYFLIDGITTPSRCY